MGKFLNGVAIGVLATLIYKKEKERENRLASTPSEKTPLQNLVHSTKEIKNVKSSVDTLKAVTLPETVNVIESVKKSIQDFTVQEKPRIERIKNYITVLQNKVKS